MSRTIWAVSDTHFGHENIIRYCGRPFANAKEMNEALETNWNETVKEGDIVYHLGDVYLGVNDNNKPLLNESHAFKLKGRKRLILGNHDNAKDKYLYATFEKIMVWRMFPEFGLLLTHVPAHPSTLNPDKCPVNLHGHIHQNLVMTQPVAMPDDSVFSIPDERYKNMCVEHTNYKPVNLEELRVK